MSLESKLKSFKLKDLKIRIRRKENTLISYNKVYPKIENNIISTKIGLFNHYCFNTLKAYNKYDIFLNNAYNSIIEKYVKKKVKGEKK